MHDGVTKSLDSGDGAMQHVFLLLAGQPVMPSIVGIVAMLAVLLLMRALLRLWDRRIAASLDRELRDLRSGTRMGVETHPSEATPLPFET